MNYNPVEAMTYDAMIDLARSLKGETLETISGRTFTVGVYLDCPFFTPQSTGLGRSDGKLAAERFLDRFNRIGSYRPRDYQDLTRNASYFVALVAAAKESRS